MRSTYKTAIVLLIIGGLNWLLVGLFSWDIGMIFGGQAGIVSRIIYILIGLSAIYVALTPGAKVYEHHERPMSSNPRMNM